MNTPESIQLKLEERIKSDSFRDLMRLNGKIDFFSNDYLGLAKIETKSTLTHGSTGSRLISGNYHEIEELEENLARFYLHESAISFNSGYNANLGLFSSVPQRNDIVIYDELCHASIRDGIRLGLAKAYSFKHNNLKDLEALLLKYEGTKYVAIESVYSMDGDEAHLVEIARLCVENNAYLIVDEAHSGGIYGDSGQGLVSAYGLDESVFAKLITFGKAYGSHGAIVLGSKKLRDYLINFSRPLIYTTSNSPQTIDRIQKIVDYSKDVENERARLFENINFFIKEIESCAVQRVQSNSPIQSIIIPGNIEAKKVASKCLAEGIAVKAILSPTVPKGKERIRICIHSFNSKDEISKLVECLK